MNANFEIAYQSIRMLEGGYSNDKSDAGGETYRGISRAFNPAWGGWPVLDRLKASYPTSFEFAFDKDEVLQDLVKKFYGAKWDSYKLDEINSQPLTMLLFDIIVNGGYAIKWLQRALNVLNDRQKYWEDISVDGMIGAKTISITNKAITTRIGHLSTDSALRYTILGYRIEYYTTCCEKREANEDFYYGWLVNRVIGLMA